ncbi:hypothetical protein B0H17DRAFT_1141225 [Mycena rosella]|uniref:Uncharacterized protein n=1 Tax=Mycena rosella TaxID=1033263 RepID=A0AAD7D006_MYCRO|nr:hypothetical protein B0H17DRAFT_1141225 [Mycena rosella]
MTLPAGDSPASPFRNQPPPEPTPYSTSAVDSDEDEDENMLTATGDISMSYPYYVPGALGALSPPQSRRGTPSLRAGLANLAQPQRPRPPVRRLTSETYKFRTLTVKGGSTTTTTSAPSRVPSVRTPAPMVHPGDSATSPFSSCNSSMSIGSIEDEVRLPAHYRDSPPNSMAQDPALSTPQSRFAAFMKSRDLSHSPKKKAVPKASDLNQRLGALAQDASTAIEREVARPAERPLRGYAPLPARKPIPRWGAMEVDSL